MRAAKLLRFSAIFFLIIFSVLLSNYLINLTHFFMKTQRKIILSALLALFFITNVCSASSGQDATGGGLADKMKFGLGVGRGFTAGSTFWAAPKNPSGEYRFLDIFGEYKFSDEYGLRLSVQPTSSSLNLDDGSLDVGYVNVGLTNRVYVGQDKQLCLFFGFETGILSSAKEKGRDYSEKSTELDLCKEEDFKKSHLYRTGSELSKSTSRLKFGWDYECENGLIIGGIFTSTWASADEENNNPKKAKVDVLPLSTQQLFYLGYNFAKLFD